jgi:acyl-coenzyme A synthetase/AMP-(fatty) acid ligase/acyl carrier protein
MRDLAAGSHIARVLGSTAATFDIALVEQLLPVALGATCVIADDDTIRDPMLLAEFIASRQIDFVQATPTMWSALLDHLQVRIPVAVTAGEALPGGLRDRMLAVTDRTFNGYGPTETTVYATMWSLEADRPVSIGRPLPGTRLWVLDRWGRPCAPGAVGRLLIGGSGLARGYLDRSGELTRSRFVDVLAEDTAERAYCSGDLASWSDDGLLFYHGREDDQVKIRGNRVELGEIEAIMRSLEGVADAAAVVFSRDAGQYGLAAFVQPRCPEPDGLAADLEHRIRAAFADNLPSAVRPQLILSVATLPRTSSGKTDRQLLSRNAQVAPVRAAEPENDADEVLTCVAEAFAEVLAVPRVAFDRDFFVLGGDSMGAARVAAAMRKRFGVPLPLREFLSGPTVLDVASAIRLGLAGSQRDE